MTDPAKDVVREMFIADCEALFEHYGCDAAFQGVIDRHEQVNSIGIIDAGGDDVELSLVLNIPFTILALSYPCQEMIMDLPEEQLEDWLLELANQLMGKLKNRLVKQSLSVTLGLPESFFDVDAFNNPAFLARHEGYLFEVDGQRMECWLRADFRTPGITLENERDPAAFSGEIELF